MSRLVSGVPIQWPTPLRRPTSVEEPRPGELRQREPRAAIRFVLNDRVVVHHDLLFDAVESMVRQALCPDVSQAH